MFTTTTGTGTITLTTAVPTFKTFADAGITNGTVVSYALLSGDGVHREVGKGTYTAVGTTLSRDTVYRSTNSDAKIDLSGVSQVAITLAAEDVVRSPATVTDSAFALWDGADGRKIKNSALTASSFLPSIGTSTDNAFALWNGTLGAAIKNSIYSAASFLLTPATSVANALVKFTGTNGNAVEDSVVLVTDAGDMSGLKSVKLGADFYITHITDAESSGNLGYEGTWLTKNAVWTGTVWNRVNVSNPSFALHLRTDNYIPFEGSTKGWCFWRAVPGSNPIGNYAAVGGWSMLMIGTEFGDVAIGGYGMEFDGHGTIPYGRFCHAVDASDLTYAGTGSVYTGILTNAFVDVNSNGVDSSAFPCWFIGRKNDSFIIGRVAAGAGFDPTTLTILCSIDGASGAVTGVLEPQGELSGMSAYTDSGTLALTDKGKLVRSTKSTAMSITIPPHSSVAFPTFTRIEFAQYGAGQLTLVAGSGVTLRAANGALKTRAQYSLAAAVQIATDEWMVGGDLTT